MQNKESVLSNIASVLMNTQVDKSMPVGLFTGSIGVSLFLFYYSDYKKCDIYAEKAMDYLSQSIEQIDNSFYHNFCGGISGICWGLADLVRSGYISKGSLEILDRFDKYLCSQMLFVANDLNLFDFLHGSIGTAMYLLKRVDKPANRAAIEKLIDCLYNEKIETEVGCTWNYKIGNDFNISISHGMSSTCLFLAEALKNGISTEKTTSLLRAGLEFILAQENRGSNRISMFPTFVRGGCDNNSRLGWCYGDIGIALCLWECSHVLHELNIKKKAIEICEFTVDRVNLNQNWVIDASVCHGTSGIALFFNKMYNETGNIIFKDTMDYWLDETVLMSKYKDGVAGFKSNNSHKSIDLLNGITGIGLVFLSCIDRKYDTWRKALFL